MSNLKHTPAPWILINPEKAPEYNLVKAGDEALYFGQNNADAKLIASAPELLEALKDAIYLIKVYQMDGNTLNMELKELKRFENVYKKATE